MNTQEWGPSGWIFLHSVALGYPSKPTVVEKEYYKKFFTDVGKVLPCPICRGHYNENILNNPPDDYLKNPTDLFLWTVHIHNEVNLATGKPTWSDIQAIEYYSKLYSNQLQRRICGIVIDDTKIRIILLCIVCTFIYYRNRPKYGKYTIY